MKKLHLFNVVPVVPEGLEALEVLARNVYWSWNPDAYYLFSRIDPLLWRESGQNPVKLLSVLPQAKLEELARDEGFTTHLAEVHAGFVRYLQRAGLYGTGPLRSMGDGADDGVEEGTGPAAPSVGGGEEAATGAGGNKASAPMALSGEFGNVLVAYFSAEFGLAKCLPIYSGGLGVLSGDHLKAASDLGLPLVGVGLLYRKGYFQQYINTDGWQQERYDPVDPYNAPAALVRDESGAPVTIWVNLPGRKIYAQVWRVDVGRVPLLLMDTKVGENSPEDQQIGSYLYGGDREMRLKQELLLGIGGVRVLEAMGVRPKVYHMNEGHSAFMALERIRKTMDENELDFPAAQAACSRGNVFTTHTPVPAGFDLFQKDLMEKHLGAYVAKLGVPFENFLSSGRGDPYDDKEPFNMAVYAARNSNFVNGVSQLHGEISRKIFHNIIPDVPVHEIPIGAVTNGVHHSTWTSAEMWHLLNRYLGPRWEEEPDDKEIWARAYSIPDAELWRVKDRLRARMVAFVRSRVREAKENRGAPTSELDSAAEILDPELLTIGFARRFATYKRANLILSDPERLKKLLCHPTRPVQLVFAGKAHPKDDAGKKLIQQIMHAAQDPEIRGRIAFVENYDLTVARYLVSGVDLWLNNPRRPLEASGTSGMKVVFNGGLNLSVLDGWWCEGFEPDLGWSIGAGEVYSPEEIAYGDRVESEAIYHLLETEIAPLFYERDPSDLPREWIRRIKHSLAKLCPQFNNHRMVREYTEWYYKKSAEDYARLSRDDFAESREEAEWLGRIYKNMGEVRIDQVTVLSEGADIPVGGALKVQTRVRLGRLRPDEIQVEAYSGPLDEEGHVDRGRGYDLEWVEEESDGWHRFEGAIPCVSSGQQAFQVRVRPHREGIRTLFAPVCWE